MGAQIGFSIGSAIGGYVDPVQVKGPRLTDAMSQTSTVGGVIPFGYGRYVTGGNIIWCDRLIEHVKRQRQGKGASSKTTTYTYTRSYAVGVCQGEIFGFHWIKRNGKKVYTSDPAATAEEKAYSAKWLGKVTLYRGGESQMPDSTIVAVEGAGNVSPFRGLAYIVVENDDLTDLSGAVPQYEFCVIATPPEAYLTSKPYPQLTGESQSYEVSPLGMSLRSMVVDGGAYSEASSYEVTPGEIKLKDSYNATYMDDEVVAVNAAPHELVLVRVLVSIDAGQSESVGVHADPQLIELKSALVTIAGLANESTTVRVEPIGISLT
ncbi:hypothetical protein ATCM_01090 [Stenotrophomonas sp. ATCM1_4]|uniref:hypothetical protein n=1 Tax=Stenotrophomonas sp. ATCM1_4 TaxID=2259330 RepID=UPI00104EF4BC|nr:hypothetical protein [Stenotrophomonas sp. ATCM1_4]TDB26382.1 hypothetical protein ATCM_01090 [Stenotrophomonas sp. ATCM1_4]